MNLVNLFNIDMKLAVLKKKRIIYANVTNIYLTFEQPFNIQPLDMLIDIVLFYLFAFNNWFIIFWQFFFCFYYFPAVIYFTKIMIE